MTREDVEVMIESGLDSFEDGQYRATMRVVEEQYKRSQDLEDGLLAAAREGEEQIKHHRPHNEFWLEHCKDIRQSLILELGIGPSCGLWYGKVESIDWNMEHGATWGGWMENFLEDHPGFENRYDVVSSVWSISYGYDPGQVIRNCIAVLKPGGHLYIATRTLGHHRVWDDKGHGKWAPTVGFMYRLHEYYKGIEPVAISHDGVDSVNGLWMKVKQGEGE